MLKEPPSGLEWERVGNGTGLAYGGTATTRKSVKRMGRQTKGQGYESEGLSAILRSSLG